MLNDPEREEGQGPEEGEYHFSDEGAYEMGEEEAKAPVVTEASGLAAKFSTYRRAVIIGAIAAAVFLVAYLVIPPLTSSTPTEITAVNMQPSIPNTTASPIGTTTSVPTTTQTKAVAEALPTTPAEGQFKKGVSQLMEKERIAAEKAKVMAHLNGPKPAASATPSPVSTKEVNAAQAGSTPTASATESALPPTSVGAESAMAPLQASAENKAVLERLTAVEETNTKVIGQLHAEYAQKVADYDAQNKVLQEQVRTLNTRLASMEVEMSKLVQALNSKQAAPTSQASNETLTVTAPSSASAAPVVTASTAPGVYKSNYTVQAIIPGRAWLRAESGETITVAEGDVLRSLGRVTKIDPYDGTILIDTGNKLVTLTYGNGDYT